MIFALLFPLVITRSLNRSSVKNFPEKFRLILRPYHYMRYNQLVETLIVELDEYKIPFVVIDDTKKISGICYHEKSSAFTGRHLMRMSFEFKYMFRSNNYSEPE